MQQLDNFDLRILAALQEDGSLSNSVLANLINLSEEESHQRRLELEKNGYIQGYHAFVDRTQSGFDVCAFVAVTLVDHHRRNAEKFSELLRNTPQILEAHAITEEADFMIKVVSDDLESLSSLIGDRIQSHDAVKDVKTLMSLETIKETHALPL